MNNILIIQAARFGDLIQTKRLVLTAQKKYRVHLAIDNSLTELASLIYPATEIHGFNFHSPMEYSSLKSTLEAFNNLKNISFQKIYNCNFAGLSASLSRLFPEDKVIGLRPNPHSDGGILKSAWSRLIFSISKNRKLSAINITDFWGWFSPAPIDGVSVNPVARGGGKGLGVILSGREQRRSLSSQALSQIITICANKLKPERILLFGMDQDNQKALKILRSLPAAIQKSTYNLCGKTGYTDLVSHLSGLDLLLTPDTGSMHLAASLGVPVMAFFLSSAFCHETGPYGEGHYIWQTAPVCAPCVENATCTNNLLCHSFFSSRDFFRALTRIMENKIPEKDLPSGLQLWKTGFDKLGQNPVLISGHDPVAQDRKIIRQLLMTFLKIPASELDNLPSERVAYFTNELFPFSQWALPPYRYI